LRINAGWGFDAKTRREAYLPATDPAVAGRMKHGFFDRMGTNGPQKRR
jgi:hypothetical protein